MSSRLDYVTRLGGDEKDLENCRETGTFNIIAHNRNILDRCIAFGSKNPLCTTPLLLWPNPFICRINVRYNTKITTLRLVNSSNNKRISALHSSSCNIVSIAASWNSRYFNCIHYITFVVFAVWFRYVPFINGCIVFGNCITITLMLRWIRLLCIYFIFLYYSVKDLYSLIICVGSTWFTWK